ncbi:MAG: DUF1318 domain-containing protein [candidate division Zixibacteria bacterium]|nr:DUF1318 domain-containing protein [candidate division Zixibacteria bacterium]
MEISTRLSIWINRFSPNISVSAWSPCLWSTTESNWMLCLKRRRQRPLKRNNEELSMRIYSILFFLIIAGLSSCTIKPPEITVTGEKTVLERQLLGEYELQEDAVFLPAVSGGIYYAGEELATDTTRISEATIERVERVPAGRREYLTALANHRFNLDDINRFKDQQVIGENNEGYLHIFEEKTSKLAPPDQTILNQIVAEENEGRRIIMMHVIRLRADLTEENLPEIERVFSQRNIAEEKPGRMIQLDNGEWVVKQ